MTAHRKPLHACLVSVVLPVFNEEGVLPQLRRVVERALAEAVCRYEIVFINDGSSDRTAEILDAFAEEEARIRVVHLSRNFGHPAAVRAGILHASGDAVIVMDSDLQDDPSAFGTFLREWQMGWDVVYAVRVDRKEGPVKRLAFYLFYRILARLSDVPIPKDAGNFGLIDARVAEHIRKLSDRDWFFPGLRCWVGFRQKGVPVARQARYDATARVSFSQLCRLAKSAVFSFSRAPLAVFYTIAAVATLVFLASLLVGFHHQFIRGLPVPQWVFLVVSASFFGALNALGIAVIGEYTVRIYDQVRNRPAFIVERCRNPAPPPDHSPEHLLDWMDAQISTENGHSQDCEPALFHR